MRSSLPPRALRLPRDTHTNTHTHLWCVWGSVHKVIALRTTNRSILALLLFHLPSHYYRPVHSVSLCFTPFSLAFAFKRNILYLSRFLSLSSFSFLRSIHPLDLVLVSFSSSSFFVYFGVFSSIYSSCSWVFWLLSRYRVCVMIVPVALAFPFPPAPYLCAFSL